MITVLASTSAQLHYISFKHALPL